MAEWSGVEAFLDRLIADGRCNGLALAVAVDGKPTFKHYAGFARPELAAGPDVCWPVASIIPGTPKCSAPSRACGSR